MEAILGIFFFIISLFIIIYVLSVIPSRIKSVQRQNAEILKRLERILEIKEFNNSQE